MKKIQSVLLFGTLLVAPMLAVAEYANADTSVIMLMNVEPGKPNDHAVTGMKFIIDCISRQKNLGTQEF